MILVGIVVLALVAALGLTALLNAREPASRAVPSAQTGAPGVEATSGNGELTSLGHTWGLSEYETFYNQQLEWARCEGAQSEIQCATVKVPMDWTDPGNGRTIDLRIARRQASSSGQRLGSIVYDPGGPGGSGADFVVSDPVITEGLARHYDLVGIDPRGVGGSQPIDCLTDSQLDTWTATSYRTATDEGFAAASEASRSYAQGCRDKTGELLGHVDTWSAARDMDVIRAALGEERLHYLGASYGTLLGATYAGFYPERVGRFVLDGAMDPRNSGDQVTLVQARSFENALRAYVEACLRGVTGDCPLSGTTDEGIAQVRGLIDRLEENPLKAGNRELTAMLGVTGIIFPLYDDQAWFILSQALAQALAGDPTTMMYLADTYNDRQDDGSYASNSMEAFTVISCSDYPTSDRAAMDAEARELVEASPTFGPWMGYGDITCGELGVSERVPGEITAEGADPILVVGTTGDPATPYAWAEALAGQLSSGHLLTFRGEGHTAYNRASSCIDDAIDTYFISGEMPETGTVCRPD